VLGRRARRARLWSKPHGAHIVNSSPFHSRFAAFESKGSAVHFTSIRLPDLVEANRCRSLNTLAHDAALVCLKLEATASYISSTE
jgi:hypothetical protein